MTNEIHRRALSAAARLALGAIALEGCAAKVSPDAGALEPVADAREPTATSADEPAGHATASKPAEDATHAPSCWSTVEAAFPTPGEYPGRKKDVGVAVQACCAELIIRGGDVDGRHRWDCCANLPEDLNEADDRAAMGQCTPWGPPVPPAMRAVTRRAVAIA